MSTHEEPCQEWRPQAADTEHRAIVQLPEDVVNKIAAGEVVQRPANAVKELIENSLDAGATRIEVTAVNGGLGSLRIEDNGHGISHTDLPLLTTRFATSKLQKFDDLKSIGTYGFRGEALASLAMVCRTEVITRKKGSPTTYSAKFRGAELTQQQQLPAGMNAHGTVIKATDMFYSMPQRRGMLNKPADEYRLVVDVITRYAIQYPFCSFVCRKAVSSPPDLSTSPSPDRATCIKRLYSAALCNSLINLTIQESETLHFRANILASNLTYFGAKTEVIIFINGRLVLHEGLVKMVKVVYSGLLPKKAAPFVFIELNVLPQSVDVNAHPTKEKVIFLDEADIVAHIEAKLRVLVEESLESSGDLHQKRKLSSVEGSFGVAVQKAAAKNDDKKEQSSSGEKGSDKKRKRDEYEHQMNRSDHTLEQGALERYFTKGAKSERRDTVAHRLQTVVDLMATVQKNHDPQLRTSLSKSVYVGSANRRFVLLQLDLDLFLVDFCVVSAELFYQRTLASLRQHPVFAFDPQPLVPLLSLLLDSPAHGPLCGQITAASIEAAVSVLAARAQLLNDLFSLQIETVGGTVSIAGIPQLVEGYVPPLHKLPLFLWRVGSVVQWQEEKACISSIAEELADLYMIDDGAVVEPCLEEAADKTVCEGSETETPGQAEPTAPLSEGVCIGAGEAKTTVSKSSEEVFALDSIPLESDEEDDDDNVPASVKYGGLLSGIAEKNAAASQEKDVTPAQDVDAADESKGVSWTNRHVIHPAVKSFLLPPSTWRDSGVLTRAADLPTMYKIFERC